MNGVSGIINEAFNQNTALIYGCVLIFIYGMIHTLLPGHGKTIICGYYVGRKRDIKKMFFITAVTVIAHIFSSILLGLIAMKYSRVLVDKIIFPKIQVFAAIILMVMGMVTAVSGILHYKKHASGGTGHDHSHGGIKAKLDVALGHFMSNERTPFHGYAYLFWLGLAAGVIPCIEPFTIMIFAIALGKIYEGFLLVLFFGAGVFISMMAVGLTVTSEKFYGENPLLKIAGKIAAIFKLFYPYVIIILGLTMLIKV